MNFGCKTSGDGHICDLWSLLAGFVKRVSDFPVLRSLGASLHELIVNFLLDEGSCSRATRLSLVEEQRAVRQLHGFVHCKTAQYENLK